MVIEDEVFKKYKLKNDIIVSYGEDKIIKIWSF